MSIKLGNYIFSEPVPIASWSPPCQAGLYAIMVFDPLWTPFPFRVIYFGESGNLSEQGFLRSHHKYADLIQEAGSERNLYISVYPLPNSTLEIRGVIKSKLIEHYRPACNRTSVHVETQVA